MAIQEQVHDHFKVFVGSTVDELNAQVSAFTANGDIAAKSIGVEYLESRQKLILSLGYQTGNGYASQLLSKVAGTVDVDSPASLDALAQTLSTVAAGAGNVICHELYVTSAGEVTAVFLAHR